MTRPSLQEINRVAAGVRLAGELLEAHGTRALVVAEQWAAGPVSANLEPVRGHRSESMVLQPGSGKVVVPIPADPTGEEAVGDTDPDRHLHAELVQLVARLDADAYRLRVILRATNPHATGLLLAKPETPAEVSLAGWCVSCHRDGAYCEPVAMRPDGTRRYRDFCNWCGEFQAQRMSLAWTVIESLPGKEKKDAKKRLKAGLGLPPLELVKARHEGRRVTQRMVEASVAKSLQRAS